MELIALALVSALAAPAERAALTAAVLEGTLDDEKLVLDAALDVRLVEEGWVEVDLFDRRASVERLRSRSTGEGARASCAVKGGRVVLVARGPGEFRVQYTQRARLEESALRLYLPRGGATKLVIRAKGPPVELDADAPACVLAKENEFTVFPAGAEALTLRVRPRREEMVRFRVAEELTARVAVDAAALDCTVRFSVLSGELRKAEITTPEGLELVSVESKNVTDWTHKDRRLGLAFSRPKGTFEVALAFDVASREVSPEGLPSDPEERGFGTRGGPRKNWHVGPLGVAGASALTGSLVLEPADEAQVEVLSFSHLRRTGARAFSFASGEGEVVCRAEREEALVEIAEEIAATLGGAAAEIEIRLSVAVQRGTLFGLDARLPPRTRIVRVAGPGLTGWTAREGSLGLSFAGLRRGTYGLDLRGEAEADAEGRFEIAPLTVDKARRHSGRLTLSAKGRRRLVIVSKERAYQGAGSDFSFHDPRARVVAEASALEAEFSSTAVVVATVGEEALRMELSAMLRCDRAPTYAMKLWTGPGVEAEELTGRLIRSFDPEPDGFAIEFTRGLLGQESVKGRLWKDLRGAEVVEVPLAGVEGARKSRGYLILRAEKDLGLSVGKASIALTPCPPAALPPWAPRPDEGDMIFKYSASGGTLTVEPKARTPELRLASFTVLSFDRATASADASLKAEVRRARVGELAFVFPPGAKNILVESNELNRVEELPPLADGSPRRQVILRGKREGGIELRARFQHVLDEGRLAFHGVRLEGAEGERGFVALAAEPEIDLEEDASARAGCALSDWAALPDEWKRPANALSVFSFANERPALDLRANYIERQERVPAAVKEMTLTTIVDPEGRVIERARMSFQSKGRTQYLSVRLPERAVLWGTYVDGEPVRSSEGEFGEVMVPIRDRTSGEIELRYLRAGEFAGNLSSPRLAVSSGRAEWKVYLPEEFKVLTAGGNMTVVSRPQVRPGWAFTSAFGRSVGRVFGYVWPVLLVLLKILAAILVIAVTVLAGYLAVKLVWLRTRFAVKAALVVGVLLFVVCLSVPSLMAAKGVADRARYAPSMAQAPESEPPPAAMPSPSNVRPHAAAGRRDPFQFKRREELSHEYARVQAPDDLAEKELAITDHFETDQDARDKLSDLKFRARRKAGELAKAEAKRAPGKPTPELESPVLAGPRPPAEPMAPEEDASRATVGDLLKDAKKLVAKGKYDEALSRTEEALGLRPDSSEARALLRTATGKKRLADRRARDGEDAIGDIAIDGQGRVSGVYGLDASRGGRGPGGTEVAPAGEAGAAAQVAAQVAQEGRPPRQKLAFDTSIYNKILGGRAKGALPVRFDIPASGAEYVFTKEFTGTTTPEVSLRYVRSTRSLTLVLVVALVAAAAAVTVRVYRSRSHHRDTETRRKGT